MSLWYQKTGPRLSVRPTHEARKTVCVAKRVMTDNGFSYVKNRSLAELLNRHGIRHLTTQPYRPRTNGKVERFHQTMAREWANRLAYRSHRHRNAALATLARQLQPATATQLTQQPATHQPRSQRPWVGQLRTARTLARRVTPSTSAHSLR